MKKATSGNGPRIYVASLSDYNAGNPHGTWIEDCSEEDVMKEEIAAMLRASKHPNVEVECPECTPTTRDACTTCNGAGKVPSAEEWAIHDHEGFCGIELGEHPAMAEVAKHARMLTEHNGAWAAYVNHVGEKYATEDGFQDCYRGEYDSPEAYAEELISETHDLKSMGNLTNYIDYEKFARDLEHDGYTFIPDGGTVYVFSNN